MPHGDGEPPPPILHLSYDARFLVLAYGVSIMGAIAAVSLLEQHRLSRNHRSRIVLMCLTGFTFGAVCTFATHTVALGGVRLGRRSVSSPPHVEWLPLRVDPLYLGVAVAQATVLYTLALAMASRDRYFGTTKDDRVGIISKDIRRLAGDPKHGLQAFGSTTESARRKVMHRALFNDLEHIVVGGVLAGLATFGAVVFDTLSLQLQATRSVVVSLLAATLLLAVLCACFNFWFLFRLLQWYPREEGYRAIGSLAAGAMLLAVDMLGVLSFRFTYASSLPPVSRSSQFSAAFLTGCVSVLLSAILISLAIYDLRQKVVTYTEDVDELDRLFKEVFNDPEAHSHASVMFMMATDKRDVAKLDAFLATTRSLIRKYRSRRLNRHHGSLRSTKGMSTSARHGKWGVKQFAREMLGLHTGEPGLVRLPMRSVAQAGRRRLRHQNSNVRMVRSQEHTIFSTASEGEGAHEGTQGGVLYQVIDFGVERSTASTHHHSSNVGGQGQGQGQGTEGSGSGSGSQDALSQTLPMSSGALHPKLTYSKVEEGVALFAATTGFGRAPPGIVIAGPLAPLGLGQIDEGHEDGNVSPRETLAREESRHVTSVAIHMSLASSDGDLFGDRLHGGEGDEDSLPYPSLRGGAMGAERASSSSFSSSSSQTSDTGSEEPPLVGDEEGGMSTATELVQELLNTSLSRVDRRLQWGDEARPTQH